MTQRLDERRDPVGLRVPAAVERGRQPDHDPGQAVCLSREPVNLLRNGVDARLERA